MEIFDGSLNISTFPTLSFPPQYTKKQYLFGPTIIVTTVSSRFYSYPFPHQNFPSPFLLRMRFSNVLLLRIKRN